MENINYKMGWLVVFFDLPTTTDEDKRNYVNFRKNLLNDGYLMIQYSVYARACVSHDRVLTHTRRIKSFLPPKGSVRCLFVTNIQWDKTFIFYGPDVCPSESPEKMPEQLLLW